MSEDVKVCYCFHVTRRKLLSFMRVERPRVASQLSQCAGAGTGCGWCVPFLKKLFEGEALPLSVEQYAQGRAEYLRQGKGTPPPGADT
ncbi:MAG: (2Fe-2S)-binding protein [Planctomycetia bacterium]|nr:(2Fe-2S)-binding protein [Planctomycetia bacterium]